LGAAYKVGQLAQDAPNMTIFADIRSIQAMRDLGLDSWKFGLGVRADFDLGTWIKGK
jgi:hypothetical protein